MNFDDIKSAWDNEDTTNISVPASVEKLKAAKMPIDKIKRNMFNEGCLQLLCVIIIGFTPQLLDIKAAYYMPFYAMYPVFLALSIYYFVKFYFFYKRLHNNTLNTRDNLYEVYYDIKLNIEIYKAFTYSLTPFGIIVLGMAVLSSNKFAAIRPEMVIEKGITVAALAFVGLVVIIMLATESWVKTYYGKPLKEMKKILDEFREE